MTLAETPLQQAERHVREGEHHVAYQHEIIHFLIRHDYPTGPAKRLLHNFEALLELHRRHLAHIRDGKRADEGGFASSVHNSFTAAL